MNSKRVVQHPAILQGTVSADVPQSSLSNLFGRTTGHATCPHSKCLHALHARQRCQGMRRGSCHFFPVVSVPVKMSNPPLSHSNAPQMLWDQCYSHLNASTFRTLPHVELSGAPDQATLRIVLEHLFR